MKRALALPLLLLGLVVHSASADAQSFHEKVEVEPLTTGRGATKKVIGLKLTLTLRPESYSNQDRVRVSLGPMTPKPAEAASDYDWHRPLVSDASKGYVLHQWPDIKIKGKTEKAKEVTLEVKYADAPALAAFIKPGTKTEVEVISAWNSPDNRSYWHVWGIQSVYADPNSVKVLPEPTPDAAPAAPETEATATTAKPARTRKPRAKPAATTTASGTTTAAAKPAATRKPRKPRATATAATPRRTMQQHRAARRTSARVTRARTRGR